MNRKNKFVYDPRAGVLLPKNIADHNFYKGFEDWVKKKQKKEK